MKNYAQEKQKSSIRQYNKTAKEKKEVESNILDELKIYPRKLEAKVIIFFVHTSWGSHLSIKHTIDQIQEMVLQMGRYGGRCEKAFL